MICVIAYSHQFDSNTDWIVSHAGVQDIENVETNQSISRDGIADRNLDSGWNRRTGTGFALKHFTADRIGSSCNNTSMIGFMTAHL